MIDRLSEKISSQSTIAGSTGSINTSTTNATPLSSSIMSKPYSKRERSNTMTSQDSIASKDKDTTASATLSDYLETLLNTLDCATDCTPSSFLGLFSLHLI